MFALALSLTVAGLFVGPALVAWARGRALAAAALDGAMLGIVPALLLGRILPHLVEEVGATALAALVAGYVGFLLVESRGHHRAAHLGLAVLLPTLTMHSFLDGAALSVAFARSTASAASVALGTALVLHKIPEGLFLASRLIPSVGSRGTFARIGALGATTVLGGLSGRELLAHAPDSALHIVVAVGLGVMLRMVVHRHDEPEAGSRERFAGGVAFVACLSVLAAIPDPVHLMDRAQPHELSATRALVPLLLEPAPALLAALLASELLHRLKSREAAVAGKASGWLAATVLSSVLLGPAFALARAALDPLLRRIAKRRSTCAASWLDDVAPRAERILPSYAAGVALSVAAEAALPQGALSASPLIAVPAAILAAQLVPVEPAGAVVLAAILLHKGAPFAAGLAFSLGGTAALAKSWRWRAFVVVLIALVSTVLGQLLESTKEPLLHELAAHHHAGYAGFAAAVLVAWTVLEFARQGPRAWFRAAFLRAAPAPSIAGRGIVPVGP